jgi:hypothetical protein
MTDSEVASLRAGQVLPDRDGREWRVLHDPREEAGIAWVMIRSGDQALRLTYRNGDGGSGFSRQMQAETFGTWSTGRARNSVNGSGSAQAVAD